LRALGLPELYSKTSLNNNPQRKNVMKPKEGRLQTAEHILARTIEHNYPDTQFIISTFQEETGKIEVYAETEKLN